MTQTILLAGATGALGRRIARALLARGASVTAPVRRGTADDRLAPLRAIGVMPLEIDFASVDGCARACGGAACVVSALSGLHDTIVGAQGVLLAGAVKAGVPRFIPSDFSVDFTGLAPGSNRNFDLRREFHAKLELAPIAATSIYNGAFADMLAGQMPLILYPLKRVLYFDDPDVTMDFTTMDDTAAFTALAALDPATPRALHVAGDRVSARDLVGIAGDATGTPFRLLRGGGLGRLEMITKIARTLFPAKGKVFPPWQGMQYMHNMFEGISPSLDNARYPEMQWRACATCWRRRRHNHVGGQIAFRAPRTLPLPPGARPATPETHARGHDVEAPDGGRARHGLLPPGHLRAGHRRPGRP